MPTGSDHDTVMELVVVSSTSIEATEVGTGRKKVAMSLEKIKQKNSQINTSLCNYMNPGYFTLGATDMKP